MQILYYISLALLCVAILGTTAGVIKPKLLSKFFHEHSSRLHIFGTGVFLFFLMGTVVAATKPTDAPLQHTDATDSSTQSFVRLESPPQVEATSITEIQTTEPIPFPKQTQNDPTLLQGESKVVQVGRNGEKILTYSVTLVDGQETTRTFTGESIRVNPTPEITATGTGAPKSTTSKKSNSLSERLRNFRLNN